MDWDLGEVYVSGEGPVESQTAFSKDRFANFLRLFQEGRAFIYRQA
jgi:hypothetical protein